MRQLQKKMAGGYFFAWWCCGGGGGSFVSSHSLDGVGSDKLRKTAPTSARVVDSPSATCAEESRRWFSDLLQGAATSIQPACQSPRNTAAASVFFLVSSQLFMDVLAKI